MRTEIRQSAEKSSYFQEVNSEAERTGKAKGKKRGSEGDREEFSALVDKIAARLTNNLGFDFALLVAAAPVKAPSAAKTPERKQREKSEDFRAEVKSEQPAVKSSKKERDSAEPVEAKSHKKGEEVGTSAVTKKEVGNKGEVSKEAGAEKSLKVDEQGLDKNLKNVRADESAKTQEGPEELAAEQQDEITATTKATDKAAAQNKESRAFTAKESSKDQVRENSELAPAETATSNQPAAAAGEQQIQPQSVIVGKAEAIAAVKTLANQNVGLNNLFLTSQFIAKDAVAAPAQPVSAADLSGKVMEAIKDKISASITPSSGSSGNLSGNFSAKTERSLQVKEKPLPEAPQLARAYQRVESALQEAAKSKDGKTISLRLDPPNLGTVKVDVSMREGGLHARINVESQAVNSMLRDNAHELQAALRKLGLNVDRVTVSVTHSAQEEGAGFSNSFSESSGQGRNHTPRNEVLHPGSQQLAGIPAAIQHENVVDHWVA